MTACSCAMPTAGCWPGTRRAARAADALAAGHRAGADRRVHRRRPQLRAGLPADRRALSRRGLCARCGRRTLRRSGRDDPPHRRRARPRRLRAGDRTAGRLDRLGRPPPRDDARPPGRDARHARHLGPFQRLPHLPRASICCRCCSAPSTCPAASASSRPTRSRCRRARSRPARTAASRTRRSPACRSASSPARKICWSTATARRCASTRPIPGRRRSPPTA